MKKGILEVLDRSVMILYKGAKKRVRVDSELSEAKVKTNQECMLSPFLFAVTVDVVTQFAREGTLSEFLHDDDIVLSETIKGLRKKNLT